MDKGKKGYGSSAIVYVAKYKPLQKLVGVKQIELDRFESNQIEELRVSSLSLKKTRHATLTFSGNRKRFR